MKELYCDKFISDEEIKNLTGKYIDEEFIMYPIIREDADVYTDTGELLFKFRKKVIKDSEKYMDLFKDLAVTSRGRGASAGPIDPERTYWKKRVLAKPSGYSTYYMNKNAQTGLQSLSKMRVNNPVYSNPMGFYEPSHFARKECRMTHHTIENYDDFFGGISYLRQLSDSYKQLNPEKYLDQIERCEKFPHLQIPDTAFSTITFNRNFRTALHQDKGDYGFGNLSVIERGQYSGGYFIIPQYGVAVDMRCGDHLCVDVHKHHANTPLYETPEQAKFNKSLSPIYKINSVIGVMGELDNFTRISMVCYLREKIADRCSGEIIPTDIEKRSNNKNELNYKYFINLEKDTHRLLAWKDTGFVRHSATRFDDMEACELFDRMISYWNIKDTHQHYAKCGCYHSHLSLLEKIVKYKMDMVLICEDDAKQVKEFPKKLKHLPRDGIIYLGGFIMNDKITSKEKIEIDHKQGINELNKDKHRMVMALSYIIPTWEIAEQIVKKLKDKERLRAWDIDLNNASPKIYYEYPAVYVESDGISSIRGKKKLHSNEHYEWK